MNHRIKKKLSKRMDYRHYKDCRTASIGQKLVRIYKRAEHLHPTKVTVYHGLIDEYEKAAIERMNCDESEN